MVYNDGVKILYFNTTGKRGGTESLKSFLQYLEDSNEVNVVDEATKEIDSYVGTIKHNYEIGGRYMTVGDLMDKITAEAVSEAEAKKDKIIDEITKEKDAEIARLKTIIESNSNIQLLK